MSCGGVGESLCPANASEPVVDDPSKTIPFAIQVLIGVLLIKHGARFCWSRFLLPAFQLQAVHLAAAGLLSDVYVVTSVRALCRLIELRRAKPTPSVALRNKAVGDDDMELLGNAIGSKSAGTQSLSLRGNPSLSEKGVDSLCRSAFGSTSRLSALDLSVNPHFGNKVCSALVDNVSAWRQRLRTLQLMHCGITVKGIELLSSAVEKCPLQILSLSYNSISGSGKSLALICAAPQLLELGLERCDLSDDDACHLAAELPYSSLRVLILGRNLLTGRGVASMAKHVQEAPLLRTLDLSRNAIASCEGLGRLAAAWASVPERVERGQLRIDGNQLSVEDVQHFQGTLQTRAS